MRNKKTIITRLKKMTVPFFALLTSLYFAAHGFKSITTQDRLRMEITELEQRQETIKEEREKLEHHISLLSPDHVDPDFLEELVRRELGYMHRDEIVIPHKNSEK